MKFDKYLFGGLSGLIILFLFIIISETLSILYGGILGHFYGLLFILL